MNVSIAQPYADDAARWEAVLRRDPAADGAFYYAVRSTHIYCRTTCPARRPKRESVQFFDRGEAAEQAGFRPCRRCRPHEVSPQQQIIAKAVQLLDRVPSPTLGELGRDLGLSPFHIQRMFKRATGLTPREYVDGRRLDRMKAGLKQRARVTDVIYDAGYGSSRALYEVAHDQLAMSPGAYRTRGRGERIAYALVDTSLGTMLVAATGRGICSLRFGEGEELVEQLATEFAEAELFHDPHAVDEYTQAILEYLDGQRSTFSMPTDVHATDFQQRVWEALGQIPYGETRSYKEVAAMIGRPTAVRAVARACASNPLALVVPCHRVLRSSGELGGYRWGLDRKRAILKSERGGQKHSV